MIKFIFSSNTDLCFVNPNNRSLRAHPTNGYLQSLSETHGYHKWVP
jgi:hypothetical protein